MPKNAKPIPTLSPEQKAFIDQNWRMDRRQLVQQVWSNASLTLRHVEAKAVLQYLAAIGREEVPPEPEPPPPLVELDDEQRTFIANNLEASNSSLEIAKLLFGNDRLLPSSREHRLVAFECKRLDPTKFKDDDLVDNLSYEPPISIIQLMGVCNKYVSNPKTPGKTLYESTKLASTEKRQLEALLSYMRSTLFKVKADQFIKRIDRELFESTFVRTCWDKPDLSEEHVIQYTHFAAFTVEHEQIRRTIQKLNDREMLILEENGRISQSEVEWLNATREKANASMKHIASLLKSLTVDRAKMIDERRAAVSSMHPLVEAWKHEEDRRKILALANKQRAALAQEVERLSDMDSLKCELFGIDREDILK